jgi:hypothetical protein
VSPTRSKTIFVAFFNASVIEVVVVDDSAIGTTGGGLGDGAAEYRKTTIMNYMNIVPRSPSLMIRPPPRPICSTISAAVMP